MGRKSLCHLFAALICLTVVAAAQQYDSGMMKGMKWRLVGPFRGGRVLAVTGVPGDPYTFYFGGVAGGVWERNDGGTQRAPLFFKGHISSILANAVSEANPAAIFLRAPGGCICGDISYRDCVDKKN